MKFFSDTHWNTLPLPDFRARFFVETFWELLSKNSPHFYQARLMNVLSCASEVLEALEEYEIDERSLSGLKNAVDEFNECWVKDLVANEVYKGIVTSVPRVVKQFISEKISSDICQRIRFICLHVLSREKDYLQAVVNKIKHTVLSSQDIKHKERITSELHTTISLYITYLLNKGYSPTYLFNRMEYFTRPNNYKGRTFEDQFINIIDGIQGQQKRYLLCFGLVVSDKRPFIKESGIFSVMFSELPPEGITGEEISAQNKKSATDLFATVEVEATDYINAAWKAKELVAKACDFILYGYSTVSFNVLSSCISLYRVSDITHKRNVNISLLIDFLTSNYKPYSKSPLPLTFNSDLTSSLTEAGLDCVARSLRYLRLGKETPSLEKKFLNIWIALESLFGKNDNTIIGNLTHYVPLVYAINGLSDRIEYLNYLLIKNRISIPYSIIQNYKLTIGVFDDSLDIATFFKILQDEKASIEIFNNCGDREHLKFRLLHTFQEIKNPEALLNRVDKTAKDVERQLKRIYLVRNKIAHRGHYSDIRPQLVNHLFDYASACFDAIATTLSSGPSDSKFSLPDALLSYRLGAEDIYYKLKAKPSVIGFPELKIKPV